MKIREMVIRGVEVVRPDATLREAARRMRQEGVRVLFVLEAQRLAGILTDRDVTLAAVAAGRGPDRTRVREAHSARVVYCHEDDDGREVVRTMRAQRLRRMAVLDGDERLVGMVELADLVAELTAAALDGPDGLLASALRGLPTTVRPAARLAGGARASALVIDVRAPSDALDGVVAEVKALLARLAQGTVTEADLARAEAVRSRRDRDARSEPIRRLVDLWSGRSAAPPPRASIAAWREHLATTLREPALVVVEARPD